MGNTPPVLEVRLDQLSEQVCRLQSKVDELARRVEASTPGSPKSAMADPSGEQHPPVTGPADAIPVPAILSTVTVVCFLLVVALILRTLADSKIINQQFATSLGIGYAAVLILYGYLRYVRTRRFAGIYVVCGAFLLFSIVFETHVRFQALSAPLAYVILGGTLAATTFLGLRSRFPLLISVGVVGTSLVGMALDFPNPLFPAVAALLFLANAAAYVSGSDARCSGLKWFTLVLALCFWSLWVMKAQVVFARDREPSLALGLPWMLPGLAAFGAGSLLIIAVAVFRKGAAAGPYEIVGFPICIVGAAAVAQTIFVRYYAKPVLVAGTGTAMAIMTISLALYLAARGGKGIRAAPSLVAGALVLLAVFLPGCAPDMFAVFPMWSLAAAGIGLFPLLARSLGVRLMSYAFQGFACVMAIQSGFLSVIPPPLMGKVAFAGLLACVCFVHYAVARGSARRLAVDSEEFMGLAAYSTALPFAAGLVYLYAGSRIALYGVVGHVQGGDDAFQAGQSILINIGAVAIAVAGLRMMYAEMAVIAVAVALAGAGKIFLYDFSHLRGVPLLLAISSVGMTTAIGAVLWRQWQERTAPGRRTLSRG